MRNKINIYKVKIKRCPEKLKANHQIDKIQIQIYKIKFNIEENIFLRLKTS